MKRGIHPVLNEVKFQCACGNEIRTVSTLKGDQKIAICSKCHPFFTGQQRIVDSAGRVERFQKKYAKFKGASKKK